MNKKNYAFDIEVFPNFFCATFMNVEDSAEYSSFIIAWSIVTGKQIGRAHV